MGCGDSRSTRVANSGFDEKKYVSYNGYGCDYVNYSYYQTQHNQTQANQQDWQQYYQTLQYQKQQTQYTEGSGTDLNNDGYSQYTSWQQTQPPRNIKVRTDFDHIAPNPNDLRGRGGTENSHPNNNQTGKLTFDLYFEVLVGLPGLLLFSISKIWNTGMVT